MAQTSYITDSDGLVHTATAWVSITFTDQVYFDGSIYRNSLSGSYVGGSNVNTSATSYNTDFKTADDLFNAVPPFPTQKTITYKNWVDGSGNVIASVPLVMRPRQSDATPFYAS